MDPNSALEELRRLESVVRARCDRGEDPNVDGAAEDLCDQINALDGWLRGGGFLPTEWTH